MNHVFSGLSDWIQLFQRWKCVACSQHQPADKISIFKSKSRRIFIVVGLMFIGKRTLEQAKDWYTSPTFNICKTHVMEAVDSILDVLNVKTIDEIVTCSMENRETLMGIVNLLAPNMSFASFFVNLRDYIQDN